MIAISLVQHYRVFSLDVIGYHSWRQTQTQTVIENFANGDMNILCPQLNDMNHRGLRMEFPLMQWCVALFYKLFGNHLAITRIFCFAVTVISSLGMYKLVALLTRNRLAALCSAWLFFFSPELYFYGFNPLPDNLALCFGTWAMYYWFRHLRLRQSRDFIISCILLCLSIAVKLPFIVFGGLYLSKLFNRNIPKRQAWRYYILRAFLVCLPALLWYALVIPTWKGNGIVGGVTSGGMDAARFFDILQHNLFSTLPELLVNYATLPLFLTGLYVCIQSLRLRNEVHVSFLCVSVLAALYFFYEMNMIAKVHDYYLFPFLPLIFIIVAKFIHYVATARMKPLGVLIALSFVLCPFTAYLRCNSRWNEYSPGFPKEYLWYKKQMQALMPTDGLLIVEGDASHSIVLYHLGRKGYSYGKDELTKDELGNDIYQGALYLVSDCHTDEKDFVKPYIDTLLFRQGDVRLCRLKPF